MGRRRRGGRTGLGQSGECLADEEIDAVGKDASLFGIAFRQDFLRFNLIGKVAVR